MRLLLKLAWRNVWRNKRRSFITIAAIVFAVMLSVATRGLQLGTYEANIKSIVRLSSGYLQIQKPGYQENPTLRRSFVYTPEIRKVLDAEPRIDGYTPRIYADALLSFKDNSLGSLLIGVDPASETRVSDLRKKVREGHFLQKETAYEIVVGYKLLKNLNAAIGDSVVILVQGFDGFLRDAFCKIVGTVKTGSDAFDRMTAFIPVKTAQDLLGMEDRVSVVAISLYRLKDMYPVQKSLKTQLEPIGLTVLNWEEIMPSFKQSIEFDNIGGLLFLAILIVVVAFGILNTVLMAITERFREFGIILALGMPQRKLVQLVFQEILIILFLGLIVGNLLGAGINWYLIKHPIEMGGQYAAIYEEYGFLPLLISTMRLDIFFNTTLTFLIVSLVASLYPLWKVYKLEPLKGIRYT